MATLAEQEGLSDIPTEIYAATLANERRILDDYIVARARLADAVAAVHLANEIITHRTEAVAGLREIAKLHRVELPEFLR